MKFAPQALLAIAFAMSVHAGCTWQDGVQCGAGITTCCKESGMVCLRDGDVSKCHLPCGAPKGIWCPGGSICSNGNCVDCAKKDDPCSDNDQCPCLGTCMNNKCHDGNGGGGIQ